MLSPFGTSWTDELSRRCKLRGMCTTTTNVAAALGAVVDAGMLTLDQVVDLVHSCNDANELGDALVMLAASVETNVTPAPPAGGVR